MQDNDNKCYRRVVLQSMHDAMQTIPARGATARQFQKSRRLEMNRPRARGATGVSLREIFPKRLTPAGPAARGRQRIAGIANLPTVSSGKFPELTAPGRTRDKVGAIELGRTHGTPSGKFPEALDTGDTRDKVGIMVGMAEENPDTYSDKANLVEIFHHVNVAGECAMP